MLKLTYMVGMLWLLLMTSVMAQAGEPLMITAIHITGLERTDARTVMRELPFAIGDQWSAQSGVQAERRLRNLGLFSTVMVSPPDSGGQVVIVIKERWSLFLLPEASRSDVGATSAGITLTEHNLWGLQHRLRLATRRDTGKNFSAANGGTRVDGSYLWRRIADSPISLDVGAGGGYSLFDAYSLGVFQGQYRQRDRSWHAAVDWALDEVPGEGWSVGGGLYSRTSTFALVDGLASPSVMDYRRNSILATIGYNRLDDHTTWITGDYFQYALDVAHHNLGSTINVHRQTASYISHRQLQGSTNTMDLRISAGAAAGKVLQDGLFDIGNNRGVRGYWPGELQGRYYLFANIEGRFPVAMDGQLQLVAFTDVGQIWDNGRPAFAQAAAVGLGGGVRITINWLVNGTFRFDAAYGAASKRWRYYFGTGQAF
ncbi:MAG: BamA/TamA family outer membrane protein [Mariprofundus sp.]